MSSADAKIGAAAEARERALINKLEYGVVALFRAKGVTLNEDDRCCVSDIMRMAVEESRSTPAEAGQPALRSSSPEVDAHVSTEACQQCGGVNVCWFAPSPIWNKVVREQGLPDTLCITCFIVAAHKAGFKEEAWLVKPEFYEQQETTHQSAASAASESETSIRKIGGSQSQSSSSERSENSREALSRSVPEGRKCCPLEHVGRVFGSILGGTLEGSLLDPDHCIVRDGNCERHPSYRTTATPSKIMACPTGGELHFEHDEICRKHNCYQVGITTPSRSAPSSAPAPTPEAEMSGAEKEAWNRRGPNSLMFEVWRFGRHYPETPQPNGDGMCSDPDNCNDPSHYFYEVLKGK